jgi:hypothetical protein
MRGSTESLRRRLIFTSSPIHALFPRSLSSFSIVVLSQIPRIAFPHARLLSGEYQAWAAGTGRTSATARNICDVLALRRSSPAAIRIPIVDRFDKECEQDIGTD